MRHIKLHIGAQLIDRKGNGRWSTLMSTNFYTNVCITWYNVFRFSSQFRHGGVSPLSSMNWLICCFTSHELYFSYIQKEDKTDRHDITEILLKVALNTMTTPPKDEMFARPMLHVHKQVHINKNVDIKFSAHDAFLE